MRKSITKPILTLIFLFASLASLAAPSFQNETLKYIISYKWGLIHKDAGEATLTLRKNGANYNVVLAAKTQPWADKLYKVRDTLRTTIRAVDLKPLSYTKITHEKNTYKKDEIKYSYSGGVTKGVSKRYRYDKGKPTVTEKTFTSSGPTYDMLSVFYYLRGLDYSALSKNKIYTATILSGKQKETIKIRNMGIEKIKLKNGTTKEAYHIRFNFTRDGGKKSSDDMDTWISTDSRHIPLYLTGKLPVGEIRAYFVG